MLRKRIAYWMIAGAGALVMSGAPVLAQEAQQPQQQQKQQEAKKQLSKQSQDALVRLHALAVNREHYATAAAQRVENARVKSFLTQRAKAYKQADAKIQMFAKAHDVDLQAPELQEQAQKVNQEWQQEMTKLEGMNRAEAAQHVLTTFVERNNAAIKDLRTIRGEAVLPAVRQEINNMIASLEQESTRAQALQRRIKMRQEKKGQPSS